MSANSLSSTARGSPIPNDEPRDIKENDLESGPHSSTPSPKKTSLDQGSQEAIEPPVSAPLGSKAGLTVTQFWIVLFGLNMGMLLTALDFNIVATAVPIISSQFNEYANSAWLGTGFLITFALVLPVYSKLGDVFGRKSMFLLATAIFTVGSALCGWSTSMTMLIWSRAVQGVGAGGIYGLVNVILTDLVELQQVGKFLAITGVVWALADVAGPLLGGAFSQYATWRWCFWLNLIISPISFVIVAITLRVNNKPSVPSPSPDAPAPPVPKTLIQKLLGFDYIGAILMSGATVSLVLGLSWGGNVFPWSDSRVIGTLTGGAAMLVAFVVTEHFAADPMVFPSMFKNWTLLAIFAAEFTYGMTLLGSMYYVPQFFQLVFGDSATLSGVGLLPMMLGIAIGNPIAAFITSKWGLSVINAIWGTAFEVIALGVMTRWDASTTRAESIVILVILGTGMGSVLSGLLLSAQVAVPPMHIGIVTGLAIFIQTVGDIFGIAVFAAVYVNKLASFLGGLGLSPEEVVTVLSDVQMVREGEFDEDMIVEVVEGYAKAMQNGWWLLFGCACAAFLFSCVTKQHKFGAS